MQFSQHTRLCFSVLVLVRGCCLNKRRQRGSRLLQTRKIRQKDTGKPAKQKGMLIPGGVSTTGPTGGGIIRGGRIKCGGGMPGTNRFTEISLEA